MEATSPVDEAPRTPIVYEGDLHRAHAGDFFEGDLSRLKAAILAEWRESDPLSPSELDNQSEFSVDSYATDCSVFTEGGTARDGYMPMGYVPLRGKMPGSQQGSRQGSRQSSRPGSRQGSDAGEVGPTPPEAKDPAEFSMHYYKSGQSRHGYEPFVEQLKSGASSAWSW
eukprot:88324-Prymnesium_polylepis.1